MKKRFFINLKYIAIIIMLFSFTGNVYADNNYLKDDTENLFEKCNEQNKCIPICVYSTIDSDSYEKDLNNGEKAYIGYYFSDKKWEIGTELYDDSILDNSFYMNLIRFNDTRLPKTDIYWENYGDQISWVEAQTLKDNKNAYQLISDDFTCPSLIYVDITSNYELCFANSANRCEEQNKLLQTKFDGGHPIKYSFADSLKKVIDETYNELHIDDSSSEEAKAKFLHDADPDNITYDSTKSGKENVEANCEYVKSKMEDQDSYINTIVSKSSNFSQSIDDKLTEAAKKIDTRNTKIYNMKDLGNILTNSNGEKRDIKDSEGTLYADKLGNIYEKSALSSMRYYGEVCSFQFDEAKFLDKVKEEYETKIYNLPKIDLDSKFDCNSISGIADLISTGYFIIEILALILLVGLTVLDYAKVIMSGEQDEMKKSNKRLLTRIIIAALILLLPMLINLILGVFHIQGFDSDNPLCVEIKNK